MSNKLVKESVTSRKTRPNSSISEKGRLSSSSGSRRRTPRGKSRGSDAVAPIHKRKVKRGAITFDSYSKKRIEKVKVKEKRAAYKEVYGALKKFATAKNITN